jgi:replicative superfamily II helicase
MAHWTLSERKPTLISIPTGTGKTAVTRAAPFLGAESARRVLVLAPARQIRQQLVGHFARSGKKGISIHGDLQGCDPFFGSSVQGTAG